jgi:hypothetical protein
MPAIIVETLNQAPVGQQHVKIVERMAPARAIHSAAR